MTSPLSTRDAQRSRSAILNAAERAFAERGYEGASLGEIANAAGLSRATPSYFFGSKHRLYVAILERVFAERDIATREAFEPLVRWARGEDRESLRSVLASAASDYTIFLHRRPAFVQLLQREELSAGRWLRSARRESAAMTEAFSALHAAGGQQGVRPFRVDDAVLLFVSLTFSPLAQRHTFMVSLGRDLDDARTRRRHLAFVVDQLLHLVSFAAED